jgi:acyl-CoA thioesterase YciA
VQDEIIVVLWEGSSSVFLNEMLILGSGIQKSETFMSDGYTAIQIVMMPRDTNPHGTIFGGVILSYIDMAGAISARREILLRGGTKDLVFVTVAINRVEFKQPVLVGDVVRFETSVAKIGKTSITMHINVEAERGEEKLRVTEAEVVYVGIREENGERKPTVLFPG